MDKEITAKIVDAATPLVKNLYNQAYADGVEAALEVLKKFGRTDEAIASLEQSARAIRAEPV